MQRHGCCRALLWLHEQEVIRLNKGLAVFRPAMTIHLKPETRGFAQADFAGSSTRHPAARNPGHRPAGRDDPW